MRSTGRNNVGAVSKIVHASEYQNNFNCGPDLARYPMDIMTKPTRIEPHQAHQGAYAIISAGEGGGPYMTDSNSTIDNNHPIARITLAWYDIHRRELPWRDNPNPYWVLLSEYMLQQTQVKTVLPYFYRFINQYPSIQSLAAASDDDVMALWAGLGYYSRARNLLKAVRMIQTAGSFPSTVKELQALPGVGPYIAGAIGSIALGLDVPAVDGNHHRVLSRLFRDKGDRNAMWTIARQVLPAGRAGDFNQALMDLGAQICTSKNPKCHRCPLVNNCMAHMHSDISEYPVKPPKKKKARRFLQSFLWIRGNKILMCKRPQKGLFGGLYEPPTFFVEPEDSTDVDSFWFSKSKVHLKEFHKLGTIKHVLTHMNLEVTVFTIDCDGELDSISDYVDVDWFDLNDLSGIGLSTLAQKTVSLRNEDIQLSLIDSSSGFGNK